MLFNLYSEFMIQEAMEGVEGIRFGGVNLTNLRYADDAVLMAEKREKMQLMIDRLITTLKAYGMEINVEKTKVMIMNGTEVHKGMQRSITLQTLSLDRSFGLTYVSSWIR